MSAENAEDAEDAEEERRFAADRGDAGERLDRALVRHLAGVPGLSRTRLQEWIAAGRVQVNGAAAGRPAERLALGDQVTVLLPDPRSLAPSRRPPPAPEEMPLAVLYEDDWLIALAKPPGLVVHPTFGHWEGTLLNALLWHLRATGVRPGFVSRLDKGTSGVLLAAKSGEVHGRLARAMRTRAVAKDYLAVVYGSPGASRGRIERPLLRDPQDSRRMSVAAAGRPSVTLWEALAGTAERAGGVRLTLLRCRLLTGRMHQIRVHLRAAGLPIVGDPLYGEPRWKGISDVDLAAACRGFPRQALHAWRLALPHPVTGAPLALEAPLPDDLAGLLAAAGLPRS